jgi:hypothetical protein
VWHACRVNKLQAVPQTASRIVDVLAVSENILFFFVLRCPGCVDSQDAGWISRLLDILDALDTVDTPAKVGYPGHPKFGFPKIVQAQAKKTYNI